MLSFSTLPVGSTCSSFSGPNCHQQHHPSKRRACASRGGRGGGNPREEACLAKGLPPQMTPSLSLRRGRGASLHSLAPGRGNPRQQEGEAPLLQFPSLAPSKADRKQRPGGGWEGCEASWGSRGKANRPGLPGSPNGQGASLDLRTLSSRQ